MNIVVRQLEVRDIQSIRRVTWETWLATSASFIPEQDLRAHFEEHYNIPALTELFKTPDVAGYIIEVDQTVAGFTRTEFRKNENRFYISSLYVLPSYQGGGLGRKLLEMAEQKARHHGLDRVWLSVMADDTTALSWYAKLGFYFVEQTSQIIGKTSVVQRLGYRMLPNEPMTRVDTGGPKE